MNNKKKLAHFFELIVVSILIIMCANICTRVFHNVLDKHLNNNIKHEALCAVVLTLMTVYIAYHVSCYLHEDENKSEYTLIPKNASSKIK